MSSVDKIQEVIDTLRPFLISESGDIQFIKYENNIVYVKMLGNCANCAFIDFTITDVIENALKEEIPEIEKVINLIDDI